MEIKNYQTTISTGLLHNLPFAVYMCDAEGRITWYNHAAVKLWGQEPDTTVPLWSPWRLFRPDGSPLPMDECAMVRTLKQGLIIEGEEILIELADGSRRNIMPHPVPVFDDSGKISGATNTLIDITEQRADERTKAMFAAIVESSEDAIISKTLDGIITTWNQGAERLFGYKAEEIIGRSIMTLIPDDRHDEEVHIISKIRNRERVEHFETIRRHKSGHEIQISLTVSPIKDRLGRIIGASKIARDISRQKQAEDRLQRYAESLEILNTFGKVISEDLDVQGILQKVTDATTQLTGAAFGAFFYNHVDENKEAYMLYTLSGAPKEAFEKLGMPRNTAVFKPTFSGEAIVRVDDITKDPRYGQNPPLGGMPRGHLPVVSYLAVPVVSKSGEVIGGLLYGHPEPARFTAEHESLVVAVASQASIALDNAKLYEEVKMLNAKKDEFIGLTSHELKTPVTSINGYLQIIERSLGDDDRNKAFISKTRQQVNKLSALITDLLDVTRIQTGKLPFNYAEFDLLVMLHDVIEMLQQTYPTHRLVFEYEPGQLMINADQQRIEQVVINLISNAVKYSPKADRVIIRATSADGKAKVAVQDFGIGISQDQYERIFSRFYRVENLASHMSGLGIGLYISSEIIGRHNGRIWLNSTPGEGSTFFFELPA